jgi:hypothetical protein
MPGDMDFESEQEENINRAVEEQEQEFSSDSETGDIMYDEDISEIATARKRGWRTQMTLLPRSTVPTMAGCRLGGCSVLSGRPLRSRAVAGVSLHVCVGLGPVLASHAPSPPAAAAAAWRGRGRVPIAGWSFGGVGPERGLRGGGRRGWYEEWARRG